MDNFPEFFDNHGQMYIYIYPEEIQQIHLQSTHNADRSKYLAIFEDHFW